MLKLEKGITLTKLIRCCCFFFVVFFCCCFFKYLLLSHNELTRFYDPSTDSYHDILLTRKAWRTDRRAGGRTNDPKAIWPSNFFKRNDPWEQLTYSQNWKQLKCQDFWTRLASFGHFVRRCFHMWHLVCRWFFPSSLSFGALVQVR